MEANPILAQFFESRDSPPSDDWELPGAVSVESRPLFSFTHLLLVLVIPTS